MIRLRTLGQSDLVVGEDRDENALLSQPKRFALLCYLALPKPGVMVRRDALLGLFWPEDSEQPRVALRQALSHIRKVLGHDVIVGSGSQEVGLNPDLLWCDVAAFEQALDANDLTAAIQLYQGELLQGFHLSHDPEWEHWLDGERVRLAHRYAVAMEGLAKSEVVAIMKDPMVLLCHPLHPLAINKSIKINGLARHKFISFESDIPNRKPLDKLLR